MAVQLSSGLRDHMLVTGSFKSGLDGGVLRVYAGTVPATADADISGNTLLCTISNNAAGTGINFETTVAAGVLTKAAAEVWRGQIVTNGTATFFRFSAIGDTTAASTTAKRLQGICAVVGGDLNFSNVNFVSGNYRIVDSLNVTLPTV